MVLEQLFQQQSIYLQIARFFVVFFIGTFLTRTVLMPAVKKLMEKKGSDRKAKHSMENITGLVGFMVTLTVALQAGQFGNLVTILGTIAAAATVAIGFGMRDQIASVVAGIFIHTDNPFIRGDYITVNEYEGVVKEIKLRATVLNGRENEKQVVPNTMLTTNVVKNFTKGNITKISVEVKIPVEKAEEAEKALLKAAETTDKVMEKPSPETNYRGIEDGKASIELSSWIKESENVKDVKDRIIRKFSSENKEVFKEDKE